MHKPTTLHFQHLKRVLRYLKFTINHGVKLRSSPSFGILAYSDTDWGGNSDDLTSTSAYVIFLGGNPVSWLSRKQCTVARSSTEAEYRALATTTAEVMWLSNLLHELKVSSQLSPRLLCDNLGAVHLSSNPVLHSRMKHISWTVTLCANWFRQVAFVSRMYLHVISLQIFSPSLCQPLDFRNCGSR
ncbi:cysteine-rich RLK (RECEPTOR-like protein kinase) 8 [Striga hermonthica]|uniref:Cysteine-rich RLK (RECEPTOR-like protein kinase) 8 n=1 Tax=Striga hermonthica TaxID=68872 RepID=A0A9N7NJN8_STRHE|nr:cysteine-rich RLK (RECEPTOR-like protein kinase) 8 [Striga hermonthica]